MGAFRLNHSFGISFVLHLSLALALLLYGKVARENLPAPRHLTWIEVDPIPAQKASAKDRLSRQVVRTDQAQPAKEAAPDAFLGERTQVVDHQRVSQTHQGQTAQAPAKHRNAAREKAEAKAPIGALANLGVALPRPGLRPDDLQPQEEKGSLSAQAQGEFVKGFKEGDRTLLNTREYVFYGYFQRIREKLDRAWDRSLKEKLDKYFYRGRQLASETDYTTQLLVTLDPDGQVVRVQTVGGSGTRDLDDAAVKAFNDAGPFPNPPKGLIEASGIIQVRWDFVLRT